VVKLFAYGSLKHPTIQRLFFERLPKSSCAHLDDYWVYSWKGYYVLRSEPGSRIDGLVLELTETDLMFADLWEEVPTYYHRSEIEVILANTNGREKVWCYFLNPSIDGEFLRVETPSYSSLPSDALISEAKKFIALQTGYRS
jgi:gamma-glutamylcyclotransferase (GGCT)/AIG2-like uncharacterized protein YtfP